MDVGRCHDVGFVFEAAITNRFRQRRIRGIWPTLVRAAIFKFESGSYGRCAIARSESAIKLWIAIRVSGVPVLRFLVGGCD